MPQPFELPFRLYHANPRFSPASFHVTSAQDSWLSIYTTEDLLEQLRQELPCHVRIPPVWEAFLNLPPEVRPLRPTDWAWGFMKARQLCLPKGGLFVPAFALDIPGTCTHVNHAVQSAREVGMMNYVLYIQAWERLYPAMGQAA